MRRELILLLVFSFALSACAQAKDPLLAAAQNGDVSAVKALLDQGGDVNLQDDTSRTLLMYATVRNQQAVVQLLLDKGANVNARNSNGETALTLAAREGHPEIARALLGKGSGCKRGRQFGSGAGGLCDPVQSSGHVAGVACRRSRQC